MISDTLQKLNYLIFLIYQILPFYTRNCCFGYCSSSFIFTIRFYIKHNGAIQFTVFMVLIFVSLVLFIISIALLVAGGAIIGYEKQNLY